MLIAGSTVPYKHLTIGNANARLINTKVQTTTLAIVAGTSTTVVGLTFINDPLPGCQGTVVRVMDAKTLEVDIPEGYPLLTNTSVFDPTKTSMSAFVRCSDGSIKPGSLVHNYITSVTPVGARRFEVAFDLAPRTLPSLLDVVVFAARNNNAYAIALWGLYPTAMTGIVLRDLRIVSSPGMAVLGAYNFGDVLFERVTITPGTFDQDGVPAGRTWSSNADGYLTSQGRGGQSLQYCDFEGTLDNATDIGTRGYVVAGSTNPLPGIYEITFVNNGAPSYVKAGDELELSVPGVGIVALPQTPPYPYFTPLQFPRMLRLQALAPPNPNDVLHNVSNGCLGSQIDGCTFTRIQGGIWVHGDTSVTNTTMNDSHGGLTVQWCGPWPGRSGWLWGPSPRDNIIDTVDLNNCGIGPFISDRIVDLYYSKNALVNNVNILNGPFRPGVRIDASSGFVFNNVTVMNTAIGQPGYQITVLNHSNGEITNSAVLGGFPQFGPFSEDGTCTLTLSGNNWTKSRPGGRRPGTGPFQKGRKGLRMALAISDR